jgi:hypothetical protein
LTGEGDGHLACGSGRASIMDALFLAIAVGFFVVTWGFVRLCERV